jgi:hypothetical protein
MTSKAAKKAYAKSKQGPKVSRAEQRRLDALEIERQKKEFEREKAARKAKAARERKAEKEENARLERKRAGLPEPSRHVRASQPTISRFVQGENGKRKWCDVEEESGGSAISEGEDGGDKRAAKRVAVADESKEEEELCVEDSTKHEIQQQSVLPAEKQDDTGQLSTIPNDNEIDSEDEFGDFPTLSQLVCLDSIEEPVAISSEKLKETKRPNSADRKSSPVPEFEKPIEDFPPSKAAEDQLQPSKVEAEIYKTDVATAAKPKPIVDNSEDLSDLISSQLMSTSSCESTEPEESKPEPPKPPERKTISAISSSTKLAPAITKKTKVPTAADNADCYGYANMLKPKRSTSSMLPPPIPKDRITKSVSIYAFSEKPEKDRVSAADLQTKPPAEISNRAKPKKSVSFIPTPLQSPPIAYIVNHTTSNDPPPSTQAFLEDNFEDFFPSASQEMRELLDDIDFDDLPTNTQIARELSAVK